MNTFFNFDLISEIAFQTTSSNGETFFVDIKKLHGNEQKNRCENTYWVHGIQQKLEYNLNGALRWTYPSDCKVVVDWWFWIKSFYVGMNKKNNLIQLQLMIEKRR